MGVPHLHRAVSRTSSKNACSRGGVICSPSSISFSWIRPVCTEMWPGNTADTGSLVPVVDRLRQRFSISRVCIVADRGMISAETIAELEARGLLYILGVRERTDKLVGELVLDDPAPFIPLVLTKRKKDIDYEAKAVLAGRRYIVCRNREEMKKDAA